MAQRFFVGPPSENSYTHPEVPAACRRVNHGTVAGSVPRTDSTLWQPQDGSAKKIMDDGVQSGARTAVQEINSRPACEPEDAWMTGVTRSLMRRVMGLNVTARPEAKRPAKTVRVTNPRTQVA